MSNAQRKRGRRIGKAVWARLDAFWGKEDARNKANAEEWQRIHARALCARNKPNEPPADVTWEDRMRDVLWATGRNP